MAAIDTQENRPSKEQTSLTGVVEEKKSYPTRTSPATPQDYQRHEQLTIVSKKILERAKACLKLSRLGDENGHRRSTNDSFVSLPKKQVNRYIKEILQEIQEDLVEVLSGKDLD